MRKFVSSFALILTVLPAFESAAAKGEVVEVLVTEKGFEPASVDAKAGSQVTLRMTRKTDVTCAKQVQLKSLNIKRDLPLNAPVEIDLGKLKKGEIKFACGMDMLSGQIVAR